MTIKRQYSLPNCTLILEGLSDGTSTTGQPDPRPIMSIVVNAECHLVGQRQPLTGGRDFLESLVSGVSNYAQEFLSTVPHPVASDSQPALLHLQPFPGKNRHRLTIQPSLVNSVGAGSSTGQTAVASQPIHFDLTTVQLFDLVEAVDQFLADSRTLPDLALKLKPVSKRDLTTREPVAKRAAPAALGVTSLAVTALAFSLIPIPKVEPPKDTAPDAKAQATASPSATPSTTPTPSPSATPTSTADLEALLASVPEITNPSQLYFLQRKLYNQIDLQWEKRRELNRNLIYRLGVGKDGAIVAYKPVNSAAGDRLDQTPLPKLIYTPTDNSSATTERIALFKVVFTNKGELQVSPWRGYTSKPSLGTQITDRDQLKSLQQQLDDQIRPKWQGTSSATRNLVYRVAVNKDGVFSDYEPQNQSAFDYLRKTPIPELFQNSNSKVDVEEPLAHFKVVLKPSGVTEISRW
ncbi:MAG: DUF4335 domain-containing protein [Crinalium sp.]